MNEEYGYIEYDKVGRPMFRHPNGRVEPWGTPRHHEFERDPFDQKERAQKAKNTVQNITGESGELNDKRSPSEARQNTPVAASVYMSRIAKALEIHAPVNDQRPGKDKYCRYCSTVYPCDTVNALTGQA